ncbi:MAG: HEAT repeat domain-containing protein [Acidobacteriaceae bacterium]
MSRVLRLSFIVLSLLIFCVVVAYIFENVRIAKLYREALLPSSPHSAAVDQLAAIKNRRATEALLKIAQRNTSGENGEAAIRALGLRKSPEVGDEIAKTLRVEQGLSTRKAIVDALQQLPCTESCIDRIVRYLERRWNGEKTPEENITGGERWHAENLAIEDSLRSILIKHAAETEDVLAENYGISSGSLAPSPFGIAMVTKLELRTECPKVQSSRQELQKLYSSNSVLIQQLEVAETKLGCH